MPTGSETMSTINWQSMETAPTDGTRVLLWLADAAPEDQLCIGVCYGAGRQWNVEDCHVDGAADFPWSVFSHWASPLDLGPDADRQ